MVARSVTVVARSAPVVAEISCWWQDRATAAATHPDAAARAMVAHKSDLGLGPVWVEGLF